jgi:MSHA biogenesis protein MshK
MNTVIRHTSLSILLALGSVAHADNAVNSTLTDPMRPAFASTKSAASARPAEAAVRLTAIFKTGEHRVAVIDGKVVKSGDRIGDLQVQEILADSVRYTRGGRSETARLPSQAATVRSNTRKDGIRQESSP